MSARSEKRIKFKQTAKQSFLLGLPFLCAFLAAICFSFVGALFLRQALGNSALMALFRSPEWKEEVNGHFQQQTEFHDQTVDIDLMPGFQWGEQWATISVDEFPDATINQAKVYVGDSTDILKKGVGKMYGSRFCGEGGRIVLSAHVTRHFYCLEDMKVGNTVRLHTAYGEYVYRVEEIFLFEPKDVYVVRDTAKEEELLLYTCYPRETSYRRYRIGIRCSKVSGVNFR
jgi:sortase A